MNLNDLPPKYQQQAQLQLSGGAVQPDARRAAPDPVVEQGHANESSRPAPPSAKHSGRYTVRVVSYRRRLLDEDNICEKFHVDSLRYANCLPSDAPQHCAIITTQVQVKLKKDERTEICVTSPNYLPPEHPASKPE